MQIINTFVFDGAHILMQLVGGFPKLFFERSSGCCFLEIGISTDNEIPDIEYKNRHCLLIGKRIATIKKK